MSKLKLLNVTECYTDNDGAFSMFYTWDDTKVDSHPVKSYEGSTVPDTEPASYNDYVMAKAWWVLNNEINPHSRKSIGCTYTVIGSRKVAKGTLAIVLDYYPSVWSDSLRRRTTEQSKVQLPDGTITIISTNCLRQFVRSSDPDWVMSKEMLTRNHQLHFIAGWNWFSDEAYIALQKSKEQVYTSGTLEHCMEYAKQHGLTVEMSGDTRSSRIVITPI